LFELVFAYLSTDAQDVITCVRILSNFMAPYEPKWNS